MSLAPRYKTRLVVLGAPCTGKSALVERFVTKAATRRTAPTIEDLWRTEHCISGVEYDVEVVDTSGDLRILQLYLDSYRDQSDAFLCVYSANDANSLAFLRDILPRIGVDQTQLGRTNWGAPVLVAATDPPPFRPQPETGTSPDDEDGDAAAANADGKALAKAMMLPWVAVDIESTSSVEHAFEKIITRGATSLVGMARNQSEPHLPQAQMSRLTITSRDMAERARGSLRKMRSLSEIRMSTDDLSDPPADLAVARSHSYRHLADRRQAARARLHGLKKRMAATLRPGQS